MKEQLKSLIEAALFVSGKYLKLEDLEKICNSKDAESIKSAISELKQDYLNRNSAIVIHESENGYSMRVRSELENKVMYLIPETDMPQAVLKTLAMIAYEEPIKQSKLVKIRGNRVYRYVKQLHEKELIESKPSGRTRILTTTSKFKDYFKIENLKELLDKSQIEKKELIPEESSLESKEIFLDMK